ncbi:MAG: isoamylase early set domain-containing protein [Verrucomicrobiota bacterium]|jgi:1,4-alpha-glucan branching enzyme
MYPSRIQSGGSAGQSSRYSGKHFSVPVNFVCYAPEARHVSLIGDFNGWDASANPMKRQPDGAWLIQISLSHGHHLYLFQVDGKRVLDPRAQGVARNHSNERVSMIAVS